MRIITTGVLFILLTACSNAAASETLIQILTRVESSLQGATEQNLQARDFIHGLISEISESPSFLPQNRYAQISDSSLKLLEVVNDLSGNRVIQAKEAINEIEQALSDTHPRQPEAGYEIRLDPATGNDRDIQIYVSGRGLQRSDSCGRFDAKSGNIIASCRRSIDPVFIHFRGTETVRERLEARITLGPDSTAKAILFASPLFWEADEAAKQQALLEMRSYPEYSELVELISKTANAGELPLNPSQEAIYRKAGETAERFFKFLNIQSEQRSQGSVTFKKTGTDKGSFSNDTFIYYKARSEDGSAIFKEGNPFSGTWMFLTGKYKWFRWTTVADVINNLWTWDLSLVSKPIVSDTVFEENAVSGKIIVEKDIYFNSAKAVLVLLDVVAQIDICKRMAEKKDVAYKIFNVANRLFNDPAFRKLSSALKDSELSAEQKLQALTDFIYQSGSGTICNILKDFLKTVGSEIASEALQELLKGGLMERIMKDLLTGWVSYSVKIANETVPFFYDLSSGEDQYTFSY
ncbi:MAG: hypothetical protein PHW04_17400 [Candidatus Wallbacteria bacterium]|nr:hypothetical protein [Candidatus Wallbacteria bacterium]